MLRRMKRDYVVAGAVLGLTASIASGQAVKGGPAPDAPPPPVTYHGLLPGVTPAADVRAKLGEPAHEAEWYAHKMLYEAAGRPGLFDAVYLRGKEGKLANIEAASVPEGYETQKAIRTRLGPPEYVLKLRTQMLLDYSEKGLRFVCDRAGKTIGVAYFPQGHPRVHAGARKLVDLSAPPGTPSWPTAGGQLKVGTAKRPISPIKKEWLRSPEFTIHDDMHARCALLVDGDRSVALVAADLFGMGLQDFRTIEARLAEKGYPNLIVAMSHNHAAPDTIGVYGFYPAQYVAYVQQQIEACVLEAATRLTPVREIRSVSKELPMDGARVQGLIRNARNPALLDPSVAVIELRGDGNRTLATLVNFACHVEGLAGGAKDISADFPGYMCNAVEAALDGTCLFLNGALGGMVSGDTRARTHEQAKEAGETWAKHVVALTKEARPARSATFTLTRKRLEIPVTNRRFLTLFALMKKRQAYRGRIVTEMNLLRLGDTEILTIPGELFPEIGVEIRAHMTGREQVLVGLANDQLGYIVPGYDFRASNSVAMEGWAYEETMSVSPAAGPVIRHAAVELLAER